MKIEKQSVVTTSTADAEYLALGAAEQECVWHSRMLSFVSGIAVPAPVIKVDNQGAIKMAKNDACGNRTKHIDIKYHLIQDLVLDEKLTLSYCPAENMTADIFAKPLSRVLFEKFRKQLGARYK